MLDATEFIENGPHGSVVESVARSVRGTGSRRRRLWQLTQPAREMVLGLSYTPESLRQQAARAMSKIRKGRCLLQGRDVDVLFAVLHDMGSRNALSEMLNRSLDHRHAHAVQRIGALRSHEDLLAHWHRTLEGCDMPGALWAALTHPLGEVIETAVLRDAQFWVFGLGRQSLQQQRTQLDHHNELSGLRLQAEELQGRLAAQQRVTDQALLAAREEIASLRGTLARQQLIATATGAPVAAELALGATAERFEPARERSRAARRTERHVARAEQPHQPERPSEPSGCAGSARPIAISGRHVLCVGGMQHAIARYRHRIERLGGRFEHHDGGLESSARALDSRLLRADIVICQAGCINHEAYHRVKRHCERNAKPCVYLERPSLSCLDRALAHAHEAQHGH